MKKIFLHITSHCIFPINSWGNRSIYNFLKFLSQKYDVFFINEKNKSDYKNDLKNIETFEVIKNWKVKFLDITLLFKILKIIKEKRIDIIIFDYPWFWLYLYFIKKITWVKIILREHNIEFERFKDNKYWWWKILYYYEKLICKIVDDIFFITEFDKRKAQKYFKINKWQVLNYWIDINKFNVIWNEKYKKQIRKELNIKNEEKIISFFGKLDYYPNRQALQIIFKEIYPRLIRKWFKFKLVINWWPIPDEYKNYDNVIFTGVVSKIEQYVKWCDIMINPILSWWWIKTKIIEALACGKIVISTVKWAEWIDSEITEWKLIIVDNNDWNSFVEKIIENSEKEDFVSEKFLKNYELSNIIDNLKL